MLASAIFLSAFLAATMLTLGYASSAERELEISGMKAYAVSLLRLADREAYGTKISEQGIGTVAWRAYVSVLNPSEADKEISRFDFQENGFPSADLNSAAVYQSAPYGPSLPLSLFGSEVSWSSVIPSGTTIYTVWFDDDSAFADRSQDVSGGENFTQTVFRPEPVQIVQHKAIQELTNVPYLSAKEKYNFRIRIIDGNETALTYGAVPLPSENIVAASKPVIYQKPDADIGLGELRIEVWR